jgi:hypothetical protein
VNIWTRSVFPALHSLAILSHDDMVPLLQFMIIPALDSLILRDFIACPHIPSELMDIDELTPGLTFDPDGLFRTFEEWKFNSLSHTWRFTALTTSVLMIYSPRRLIH